MNESRRLVLVRHGETEWSRDRRHTGRTDVPLTERGREQAAQLGARLEAEEFRAVLVSPLQRAQDTCALAGFAQQALIDPDLAEWDYGSYDGKTLQEIRASWPGWDLWRDGPRNGESLAQVEQRVDRVIARCRDVDGDVVLFAHGHVLRVLAARWLEMPANAGRRFVLEPASPSVLGYEHEWTALKGWNLASG